MEILTVSQASKRYKKGKTTLYRWIKEGLKTVENVEPISFYAEDLENFKSTVRKKGREPKEIDTEKLIERYRSGETAEKISETVCLSKQAIINRLRKAGVIIRKRGGDHKKNDIS